MTKAKLDKLRRVSGSDPAKYLKDVLFLLPELIDEYVALKTRAEMLEKVIKKAPPCRFCKMGVPNSNLCYAGGWAKCKGKEFEFDDSAVSEKKG